MPEVIEVPCCRRLGRAMGPLGALAAQLIVGYHYHSSLWAITITAHYHCELLIIAHCELSLSQLIVGYHHHSTLWGITITAHLGLSPSQFIVGYHNCNSIGLELSQLIVGYHCQSLLWAIAADTSRRFSDKKLDIIDSACNCIRQWRRFGVFMYWYFGV
ncbi:hypothetical protein PoB_004786600 [Plakobranchus ocellatus]|uniref:Uncharacterized protein n=1 Tax=Plakobranchus ocellatus TaxID=259542 RepID=A0AAV4BQM7_9GAST|nr:hypothetical protein PoB_004786600 [Plakobranchus ocellatus]